MEKEFKDDNFFLQELRRIIFIFVLDLVSGMVFRSFYFI